MNNEATKRKVRTFRKFFSGLEHVYGTYDLKNGHVRQVKAAVTDTVIFNHLRGLHPYGVYLLDGDCTRALAVDFDTHDRSLPAKFVERAKRYSVPAYIERSKSKGFHVWIFFDHQYGVPAFKARLVTHMILDEIDEPDTEMFPKQDRLGDRTQYGNFINAPLFGKSVLKGKTVFVNPRTFEPYIDQWKFLELVERTAEATLDQVIEMNDLSVGLRRPVSAPQKPAPLTSPRYGLLPCARAMLKNGVQCNQRMSCFRLAVHLKRLGIPHDLAIATLLAWSRKNHPGKDKRIITPREIISQTASAFKKDYRGYGCETEVMRPFCVANCPLLNMSKFYSPGNMGTTAKRPGPIDFHRPQ